MVYGRNFRIHAVLKAANAGLLYTWTLKLLPYHICWCLQANTIFSHMEPLGLVSYTAQCTSIKGLMVFILDGIYGFLEGIWVALAYSQQCASSEGHMAAAC